MFDESNTCDVIYIHRKLTLYMSRGSSFQEINLHEVRESFWMRRRYDINSKISAIPGKIATQIPIAASQIENDRTFPDDPSRFSHPH